MLTREEKRAWLDTMKGVSLGSDAFFPFGDNIERAHKSGVEYIAQAGGSVRDDHVIDTCEQIRHHHGIHWCSFIPSLIIHTQCKLQHGFTDKKQTILSL